MKGPSKILVGLPPEKAVTVTFNDGEKLIIKNIDRVDESIYDKPNLLTACVVEVLTARKIKRPGGLVQFAEDEVECIEDEFRQSILYKTDSVTE